MADARKTGSSATGDRGVTAKESKSSSSSCISLSECTFERSGEEATRNGQRRSECVILVFLPRIPLNTISATRVRRRRFPCDCSQLRLIPIFLPQAISALVKKGLVRDADFLDPITADKPDGCWTLRTDPSSSCAVLRSLAWPGYCFFHEVRTVAPKARVCAFPLTGVTHKHVRVHDMFRAGDGEFDIYVTTSIDVLHSAEIRWYFHSMLLVSSTLLRIVYSYLI